MDCMTIDGPDGGIVSNWAPSMSAVSDGQAVNIIYNLPVLHVHEIRMDEFQLINP